MDHGNVGVLILTYNDWQNTLACLERIHDQSSAPRRVVVVDNGSDQKISDQLLAAWKDLAKNRDLPEPVQVYGDGLGLAPLTLLHRVENEGTAGGMNAGLKYLLYDQDCLAFWLLHNDTLPETYGLAALLREAEKNDKAGIIGSTLLFADSDLVQCTGGGTISKYTGMTTSLDSGRERYVMSDTRDILPRLQYIDGASCLITRKLVEAIGLYDEKMYAFYEDVDYSERATKAEFALSWAPGCLVRHKAPYVPGLTPLLSQTDEPDLDKTQAYYFVRNRFYLLKREHTWSVYFSYLHLVFSRKGRGGLPINKAFKAASDGAAGRMAKQPR